jgi:hypothetical protein
MHSVKVLAQSHYCLGLKVLLAFSAILLEQTSQTSHAETRPLSSGLI